MKYSNYKTFVIRKGDKSYPKNLLRIKNPPNRIFAKGNLKNNLFEKSVAVVGSRRMTHYGKEVVDKFVSGLVSEGVSIISGFMYGVDTEAHKRAVEYGGKTVAVFGCGLDVCYPPENEKLYSQILDSGGVVISEYKPDAKPHLWKFPQRNRIVAGLSSLGVLIIEAAERSGSLITAKIARQQKKPVFAVPGPITSSLSFGTNNLIKKGQAKLVIDISDILGTKTAYKTQKLPIDLSALEKQICGMLLTEPLNADELSIALGKDIVEVSRALTLISLKGYLEEVGGKYYLIT